MDSLDSLTAASCFNFAGEGELAIKKEMLLLCFAHDGGHGRVSCSISDLEGRRLSLTVPRGGLFELLGTCLQPPRDGGVRLVWPWDGCIQPFFGLCGVSSIPGSVGYLQGWFVGERGMELRWRREGGGAERER